MKEYQVAIVGGGIAGNYTAFNLSKTNLKIIVFERKNNPSENIVCAEGISQESLKMFFPEIEEKWISTEINRSKIFIPSGKDINITYSAGGFVLDRRIFDRNIIEKAIEKSNGNIDFLTGANVLKVEKKGGYFSIVYQKDGEYNEIVAKVLVAADGPESRIGRQLGIRTWIHPKTIYSCAQVLAYHKDIKDNEIHFYINWEYAKYGYAWVFPKGNGWANIGVGIRGDIGGADEFLKKFINERFSGAKIISYGVGVVPSYRLHRIYGEGFVLVGDAARLAFPLSGAGIYPALKSAQLAAQTIINAFEKNDFSENTFAFISRKYWREHGLDWEFEDNLRKFYFNLDYKALTELLDEIRKITDGLDITKGYDYFKLFKKVFLSSPKIAKIFFNYGKERIFQFIRKNILSKK